MLHHRTQGQPEEQKDVDEEEDWVLTAIGMRVRTVPLLSAHLLFAGDEWIQRRR